MQEKNSDVTYTSNYSKVNLYKILLIVTVWCFPYNNFHFFTTAAILKPLSLLGFIFITIYDIKLFTLREYKFLISFLIFFIIYDFLLLLNLDEYFLHLKPLRNKFIGFFQFVVFGFTVISAFCIGKYRAYKYLSKPVLLKLILIVFVPSLIYGLFMSFLGFDVPRWLFFIREVFTNDIYPGGYDRNAMLTIEPSVVNIDIFIILIPTLILLNQLKTSKRFIVFFSILIIVNFLGTRSGLGALLLLLTITIVITHNISLKKLLSISFAFSIIFLVTIPLIQFIGGYEELLQRMNGIYEALFFSGDVLDSVEGSTLSRIIFYSMTPDVIALKPWGTSYSNEGYFFAYFLDPKFFNKDILFQEMASEWGRNFADFKPSFLKSIINFGFFGLLVDIAFLRYLIRLNKRMPKKYKLAFLIFSLNFLLSTFSTNLFGYLPIFFLLGYFDYLASFENYVFKTSGKGFSIVS